MARPFSRTGLILVAVLSAALATGIAVAIVKNVSKRGAVATAMTGGDARLTPGIFRRYGCTGCHAIPGVAGPDGKVGGELRSLRQRVYIGDGLNNTPDNLIRWIVSPTHFSRQSAMPETGITEAEARHVAAYLYAH
ncbi:cytochrome C [Agrobacterium sp. S2]|nr:cytochrome C [Agrobacterium sp. S2]